MQPFGPYQTSLDPRRLELRDQWNVQLLSHQSRCRHLATPGDLLLFVLFQLKYEKLYIPVRQRQLDI